MFRGKVVAGIVGAGQILRGIVEGHCNIQHEIISSIACVKLMNIIICILYML
jgi:hypothetical protein